MNGNTRFIIFGRIYSFNKNMRCLMDHEERTNIFGLLNEGQYLYSAQFDTETGLISTAGSHNRKCLVFIPKTILECGYEEGSEFAANFNRRLGDTYHLQLLDAHVLSEILTKLLERLPSCMIGFHHLEADQKSRQLQNLKKEDDTAAMVYKRGRKH